jgi:hypothetical protein
VIQTEPMDPADAARLRAEQRARARRSGIVFGSIAIAFFFGIIVKIAFFGI